MHIISPSNLSLARFGVLTAVLLKNTLLGCYTLSTGKQLLMFQRIITCIFLECLTPKIKSLWSFETRQHHRQLEFLNFNIYTTNSLVVELACSPSKPVTTGHIHVSKYHTPKFISCLHNIHLTSYHCSTRYSKWPCSKWFTIHISH